MELYILNEYLERIVVIDVFESLIWTDRYKELGDFQLVIPADIAPTQLFGDEVWIASNFSYRIMKIETVVHSVDSDGRKLYTITGNSLEKVLMQRACKDNWTDTNPDTGNPTWDLTGLPADIARYLFNQICVEGILNDADIIPFLVGGSIFPSDTILEPADSIAVQIPPKSLYEAIKELCDLFDMGFRLYRDPVLCRLHFEIYMGRNLASDQSASPAVIFSPQLDNLTNTKQLNSVSDKADVAYVFAPIGTRTVYATGASDTTAGLFRKVLTVVADDLTEATDVDAALEQRGQVELAAHRGIQLFDGEINQINSYRYGVDYNVGDIVEQRDGTGFANYLRVTEQILTSDGSGERSYPTLSKELTVTPGSWAATDADLKWIDVDLDVTWASYPDPEV